jgi:AraC family transcriptional regulator
MKRVRELLVSPTLSLTDIALECGFSSHSHLSRVFRQVLGATPSEYRRSL